ncbi:MAG: hypothetical protein ABII97_01425 [Patescibacteria group bacterium]
MKREIQKTKNKGAVSVIFALILVGLLLLISLGMSVLMLQQLKLSSQEGKSTVAIYAAEAGAERCLYQIRCQDDLIVTTTCDSEIINSCFGGGVISGILEDVDANYAAEYNGSDELNSVGDFQEARRGLELRWD